MSKVVKERQKGIPAFFHENVKKLSSSFFKFSTAHFLVFAVFLWRNGYFKTASSVSKSRYKIGPFSLPILLQNWELCLSHYFHVNANHSAVGRTAAEACDGSSTGSFSSNISSDQSD